MEESDISFGFELSSESQRRKVEFALSNSFGFGGVNVSLCFRRLLCVCYNEQRNAMYTDLDQFLKVYDSISW